MKVGEILKVDIGYGEFLMFELIVEKRFYFFDKGMVLVNIEGK